MTNKKANLNTRESTITLPSKGGWFYIITQPTQISSDSKADHYQGFMNMRDNTTKALAFNI